MPHRFYLFRRAQRETCEIHPFLSVTAPHSGSAATVSTMSARSSSLKSFSAAERYVGVSTTVCTIHLVLHWTPRVKKNCMPLDTNSLLESKTADFANKRETGAAGGSKGVRGETSDRRIYASVCIFAFCSL